jgi:hypothetical protein
LPARADIELGEHLAKVPFDGGRAEEKPGADFRVRQAFPNEPGDLCFLRGELDHPGDVALADRFPGGLELAAGRFTMTGRHVDEFMGVPASGTAIALPGITILHFRGDRVVERFSQADMLGLLIQVGAVPAPA